MKENESLISSNIEAEKALLGCALLNNAYLNLPVLQEDFYSSTNGAIWSEMKRLKKEEPSFEVDLVSLAEKINKDILKEVGGVGYIASLTNIPSFSSNARSYAEIVKDCSKRRKIYELAMILLKKQNDKTVPVEQIITEIKSKSDEISEEDAFLPFKFYKSKDKIFSFVDQFKKNKNAVKLITGMSYLDKCLGGGFVRGELVELNGQSGMNKTTFFIQVLCSFAARKIPCFYFSLEMTGEQLFAKCISYLMHKIAVETVGPNHPEFSKYTVGYNWIMQGKDLNENQKKIYEKALDEYLELSEYIYFAEGTSSITVDDIVSQLEVYMLSHEEMPMVFVDYLQILAPHTIYRNGMNVPAFSTDKQAMDYNILTLKQIATGSRMERKLRKDASELRTVVFVICANNRASYGTSATESSGRDTSTLEYSADIQLAVEPFRLKAANTKENGQSIIEEEKAKSVRDLAIKIIKCRKEKPPKPEEMPHFNVYHAALFLPCEEREKNGINFFDYLK